MSCQIPNDQKEKIRNLEFIKENHGVFCYKTNENDVVVQKAYINSSCEELTIKDNDETKVYRWRDADINKCLQSKKVISKFLVELATRDSLLEEDKPCLTKKAYTYWRPWANQDINKEDFFLTL